MITIEDIKTKSRPQLIKIIVENAIKGKLDQIYLLPNLIGASSS